MALGQCFAGTVCLWRNMPPSASPKHIDGWVQERHNTSVLAVELHLSCTSLLIYSHEFGHHWDHKCPHSTQSWAIHSIDTHCQIRFWCSMFGCPWFCITFWPDNIMQDLEILKDCLYLFTKHVNIDNKPLPEPLLTQIFVSIWHHALFPCHLYF